MPNEDMDIVELENEDGSALRLRVARYFYYNGEEFVLLSADLEGENAQADQYIMKVTAVEGETDMEEFEPIEDDALYDKLINALEAVEGGREEDED